MLPPSQPVPGALPATPGRPLRRTSGLATALVALLAAQIAFNVAEIVARYARADALRALQTTGVAPQRLDQVNSWVVGTASFGFLAFVATVVVWCIWQHRAQANAAVLSEGELRFTPAWAVGWWFIPIANLWKPFQAVRELWRASHGGRTLATWSLLGWWWATWLLGWLNVQLGSTTRVGVLIGSTGDFQPITVAQGISEERWRAVWLAFRLVAAALAIVIVRSVERLQRAAATVAAQPAAPAPVEPAPPEGGPALPPPPPTTPTVQDAVTSGERMLVIAVVIGAVALTIGGQLWVGGTRSGSSGVPPSSSSLTPVPVGGTTYEQNGVRFTYPPGWTEGPTSTSGSVGAPPLWTDGFSPPSGSSYDIVIVSAYNLGDAGSLDSSRQQTLVKNLTNALLSSLHGSLTADVAPVAIGPETGYHSLMSVTLQGVPVAVDFNVLFHGSTEYTIVCQSTSSATDEVAAGCGQVRSTFQIVG